MQWRNKCYFGNLMSSFTGCFIAPLMSPELKMLAREVEREKEERESYEKERERERRSLFSSKRGIKKP